MKTQTRQEYKGRIDWKKVNKFTYETLLKLQLDLSSSFSNFETLEPFLLKEDFPSRIFLKFVKKGKDSLDLGKDLLSTKEINELKERQSKISEMVAGMAEKYNLNVIGGHMTNSMHGFKKGPSRYESGLGWYTFKPKYKDFEK